MNDVKFLTTEYAERIERDKNELIQLFRDNNQGEKADALEKQLDDIAAEKRIKLVFIGQYTAGKSTVISALSGNNSIKIDSDISTEHPADYSWGNVILTDTPGLYTENKEHDARTIEMIKQSDLLIYCITSDLFNQYTLEDFKKWAFEYGYAGKMFLVINKMSKEAGEYEDLCESYLTTLNKALYPHSVDEFAHAFIDAKDYRDGCKDQDRDLIEYSHFENFIDILNDFIRSKGQIGKFDTPIMILKAAIDNAIEELAQDESNKEYGALLSRIERAVDEIRNKLAVESGNLIRKYLKPLIDKGYELSRKIGLEDIEFSEDDVEALVKKCCEALNEQLSNLCEKSNASLQDEIDGILHSEVATYFFNTVKDINEKASIFESSGNKVKRIQFESVKGLVENITGKTVQLATKGGSQSAQFLIKASEASGSQMHNVVLNVGHAFGVKFKPWQAVNIAKNIGNVAKILGPVVSVLALFVDIKDSVKESIEDKKVEKARIECRQSFADIESDIERQYMEELSNMFSCYDDVTKQVQEDREKVQNIMKKDDRTVRKLLDIRRDLMDIQRSIF